MKNSTKDFLIALGAMNLTLLIILSAPHLRWYNKDHNITSKTLISHQAIRSYLNDSTYVNIPTINTLTVNGHSVVYDVRVAPKPDSASAAIDTLYMRLSGMLNSDMTLVHNYGSMWKQVGHMIYADMDHRRIYNSSTHKYEDYEGDTLWSFRVIAMNDTLVFIDSEPFVVKHK